MTANPSDFFAVQTVTEGITETAGACLTKERRSRTRAKTHWPVLLFQSGTGGVMRSTTLDLSSTGFFCLSPTPYSIGEPLTCRLTVPAHERAGRERTAALECQVRVVRAEPATVEGYFGIACCIEDYRFSGA
jgi:hypothetical protein